MRADLKRHSNPPHPEALFFDEFLVVDEDENCCFWGLSTQNFRRFAGDP